MLFVKYQPLFAIKKIIHISNGNNINAKINKKYLLDILDFSIISANRLTTRTPKGTTTAITVTNRPKYSSYNHIDNKMTASESKAIAKFLLLKKDAL